jgi:spore coat protein A, manganese oxidase
MGLAGFYLIDDPFERSLNLPSGPYDVPLMIQDRDFRGDGSLLFRDSHNSVTGDTILVNGQPQPFLRVARRKYRFRFLNASNTRDYVLELSSGDPIVQIGSDGGLLAAPYRARSIELWPAERADTVIDFSRFPVGTRITLRNTSGEGSTASIMRFDVVASASDPSSLPATLRPIQRLSGARVRRQFRFSFNVRRGVWVINGKPFGGDRVDIEPRRGVPEIWTLVNNSGMGHPFHWHLAQGLILDRDGRPPHPGERGWKDTIRVDPGERVRFITRFDDHLGRFVYHCHNLAHEDHAMMGQMRVVA